MSVVLTTKTITSGNTQNLNSAEANQVAEIESDANELDFEGLAFLQLRNKSKTHVELLNGMISNVAKLKQQFVSNQLANSTQATNFDAENSSRHKSSSEHEPNKNPYVADRGRRHWQWKILQSPI